MHVISQENFHEAVDAIKDILMMYVELTDYNGFGHSANVSNRFDHLKFVDAEDDGRGYYVDMDLLRAGSAISVLCFVYDTWLEGEHAYATGAQKTAIEEGRFSRFADIEAVLKEAIRRGVMSMDDPWFDGAVQPIYRKYVLAYFRALSECDRPEYSA